MIFSTKRLFARKFEFGDLPAYTNLHTNKNVMNLIPLPVWDEERSKIELANRVTNYDDPNTDKFIYGIVKKEGDVLIGGCGIVRIGENNYEIGYRLIEDYWGNGYASEIAEGLIKHSFTHFNASRIFAEAYVKNPASIHILSKFMNRIGESYSPDYDCMGVQFEVLK